MSKTRVCGEEFKAGPDARPHDHDTRQDRLFLAMDGEPYFDFSRTGQAKTRTSLNKTAGLADVLDLPPKKNLGPEGDYFGKSLAGKPLVTASLTLRGFALIAHRMAPSADAKTIQP